MNESIVQLNQMEYIPAFESRIEEHFQYTEDNMDVLQINVGKLCNLSCKHCHVEAGPNRKEIMERDVNGGLSAGLQGTKSQDGRYHRRSARNESSF